MAAVASVDIAIADAVVALLTAAAADLPSGAVVERRLLPIYSTADLETMRIPVAPRLQTFEPASRSAWGHDHVIQIAPHLMASKTDDGQIDEAALVAFLGVVETIAAIMKAAGNARTSFAGATFMRLATEPLYDPDQLQSPGVMRAVLTCNFRRLAS